MKCSQQCLHTRNQGVWEQLTDHLRKLPGTVRGLLEVLMERLEKDQDKDMVRFSMSAIAVSRNGLLESEMVELLYDIEKKEGLQFTASFSQM